MQNKLKYILDVGSSCLRLMAVAKFAGMQRIVAEENLLYDGFMDGEFLSNEGLENDLGKLIDEMQQKVKKPIESRYCALGLFTTTAVESQVTTSCCLTFFPPQPLSRMTSMLHKIKTFFIVTLNYYYIHHLFTQRFFKKRRKGRHFMSKS